jgi:hypothetical protein
MATIVGEPARYVSGQAIKRFSRQMVTVFVMGYCCAFAGGFMIGGAEKPYMWFMLPILVAVLMLLNRLSNKIAAKAEKERISFQKGASGESRVANVLEKFPDDYRVIHDLTTPFGNIDHVVVGPSGVYVVETKNWKGVVSADGKGELLVNGRPTEKSVTKRLSRTIMDIRDKLKVLSGLTPYINGVLVFPSAWVDANWGTTGHVNCLKDEQLYSYIVEKAKGNKLGKKEIDAISQGFLAMAVMDKGFDRVTA